ncbi:ABC transporter substrate binding protein [Psychromonas sp. CNPT3]|uniref:MetQ/NlpA family ABC transporter substrate-binding protein n=1 Tax=Psychromonas sp. CNPT3 TaxID=314282 RepID=UPI0002C10FB0|nr:MetQ/NlpA family ABC transporter substrate-binding protein [Psychromonas sp. CNPT3]AGH81654.1 ABC transporter substrate binding protein [Psychromonas sp. CNPT3]
MGKDKLIYRCFLSCSLLLSLVACNQGDEQLLKVGATVGPHAQVIEAVVIEARKQGLNVKLVEFSDFIAPNAALASGDIDLNSYQHLPFLLNYNKHNETHLISLGSSILMRMGIYSSKYSAVNELPDNALIAIPNDPTNAGRGLLLLADAKLITLKENVGYQATLNDIKTNPKHFRFIEIEAAQLPRSLEDVDAATITMNYVMSAGLDPNKQGIYLEPKTAPLAVMIIAARRADKNNATYKKFVEIYHSKPIRDFIKKTFKGTIEPAY